MYERAGHDANAGARFCGFLCKVTPERGSARQAVKKWLAVNARTVRRYKVTLSLKAQVFHYKMLNCLSTGFLMKVITHLHYFGTLS
jgi:hypothetical protein